MSQDTHFIARDPGSSFMRRHAFGLTVGLVIVMVSSTVIGAGLAWEWALAVAVPMGAAAGFAMIERR